MYIVDNTYISPPIVKYLIMNYNMCSKKEIHFFSVEENGELGLRKTHDYYHQVQGQLYILDAESADLMVCTPKGSHVLKIPKDPSWKPNVDKLIKFYFNTFLDLF